MASRGKTNKDDRTTLSQVVKLKHKFWFQNLIALNFPARALQEKHKISFYDGMFDKPNKCGFEYVFQFLFFKLDKEKAAELFKFCFPSFGQKSYQEFRTVCMNWWKRLAEENPQFNFPRVSNTLFMSPGGPEMYKVLFTFTTFVMYSETRRLSRKGEDETLLPAIPAKNKYIERAQGMALKSACHKESVETTRSLQMDKYIDTKLRQQADSMLQQYREDIKTKKMLEQRRKELTSKLKISSSRTPGTPSRTRTYQTLEKSLAARTIESLGTVRAMWSALISSVECTSAETEVIDSILHAKEVGRKLEAAKLDPKVPSALLRKCTNEVYESVGTSLYQGGQLNLVSLMKLFNLSLHLLIEKLHEVGVPNFENQVLYVATQSHIHAKNMETLKKMRQSLQQIIPETEELNITLKQRVDEFYARQKEAESTLIMGLPKPQLESTELPKQDDGGLGLLPISPPLQFSDDTDIKTPAIPPMPNGDIVGISFHPNLKAATPASPTISSPQLTEISSPRVQSDDTNTKPTSPSLKQGALEFGPGASPKTSRKGVSMKEALLQRRAMRHIPIVKNKVKTSNVHSVAQAETFNLSPYSKTVETPKAYSVPSTPVAIHDDTRIEQVKSKTPDAVRRLISQVVDFTMMEMSVRPGDIPSEATPLEKDQDPAFFDISSQLDASVFQSRDKIGRTPPESFSCDDSSPLMPECSMKENMDPNGFPPETSGSSVPRDSLNSSRSSRSASDISETEITSSMTSSDSCKSPVDHPNLFSNIATGQTSSYSGLPVIPQPITPFRHGLPDLDNMDFSNYQPLMDTQPPPTPDCLSDSFGDSEHDMLPSVPVGNLIDL